MSCPARFGNRDVYANGDESGPTRSDTQATRRIVSPVTGITLLETVGNADDGDFEVRAAAFEAGDLPQPAVHPLFRLFAHRTGVQDEQVGLGLVFDAAIPPSEQGGRQSRRVSQVHLAAEGRDMEGLDSSMRIHSHGIEVLAGKYVSLSPDSA